MYLLIRKRKKPVHIIFNEIIGEKEE